MICLAVLASFALAQMNPLAATGREGSLTPDLSQERRFPIRDTSPKGGTSREIG